MRKKKLLNSGKQIIQSKKTFVCYSQVVNYIKKFQNSKIKLSTLKTSYTNNMIENIVKTHKDNNNKEESSIKKENQTSPINPVPAKTNTLPNCIIQLTTQDSI